MKQSSAAANLSMAIFKVTLARGPRMAEHPKEGVCGNGSEVVGGWVLGPGWASGCAVSWVCRWGGGSPSSPGSLLMLGYRKCCGRAGVAGKLGPDRLEGSWQRLCPPARAAGRNTEKAGCSWAEETPTPGHGELCRWPPGRESRTWSAGLLLATWAPCGLPMALSSLGCAPDQGLHTGAQRVEVSPNVWGTRWLQGWDTAGC